jgi:hypothetical protein
MMLATMLMLAVWSSAAMAKPTPSPGVHIDPGSPAAKEYAIPLAQARGGGSGGSGSGQLFGRGITRSPTVAPSSAPTDASPTAEATAAPVTPSRKRHRRVAHHAAVRARAAPRAQAGQIAAAPTTQISAPARTAGSGSGIAWMLGVAALVLALGGLGGAVLARHGRGTSASTS